MTSGLGVYLLYVNGKLIGEEILKPGFTHYAKTKLSFTYDVTDAIFRKANAENTFSVQVTPGWWADKIITPEGNDGMIGKKVAFRGVLELTFADGSKKYYGSDTDSWKAGIAGPVKHAAIFDGEEYDARHDAGKIKSHWRYEGDKWIWEFTVPKGAVASVTLPGETVSTEYAAGTHVVVR